MKVFCAWCQKEGRFGLMRDDRSLPGLPDSHGICKSHMAVLMDEIRATATQRKEALCSTAS